MHYKRPARILHYMNMRQPVAAEYCKKMSEVLNDCLKQEKDTYKETKGDQREMKMAYNHSDSRIRRVLKNYKDKIRLLPVTGNNE